MNKITAQDIANYLIGYSHEHKIPIDNFRLQKYLFYAQGWHLAVSDEKLFDDKFQAWIHGPVVRKIYDIFSSFKSKNIDRSPAVFEPPIDMIAFLKKFVIDKYFHLDSSVLYKMVHDEDAYKSARGNLPEDARSNEELDEEVMHLSFRKRYNGNSDIDDDKIDDELMEEILDARERFKNGERESYEEVFGHPQPGF